MKTISPLLAYPALLLIGMAVGWTLHPHAGQRTGTGEGADGAEAAALKKAEAARVAGGSRKGTEGPGVRTATPVPPNVLALARIVRGSDDIGGMMRGLIVVSRLTREEIGEAMLMADSMEDDRGSFMRTAVLLRWSELDPAAAAQWASGNKGRRGDMMLLPMAVSQWADQDPTAARTWVEGLRPKDRARAWPGYFSALTWNDPVRGLREVESQPPEQQANVRRSLFESWATRDPQAALAGALSRTADAEQQQLLASVYKGWGTDHPVEALESALARGMGGKGEAEADTGVVSELLTSWAKRDPTASLGRLLTLPPATRDAVVTAVVATVAERDLPLVESFVERMPAGPAAVEARAAVLKELANEEPAKAAAAVSQMPEGEVKKQTVVAISRAWAEEDPAAVGDWVKNLPEDQAQVAASELAGMWARKDIQAAGAWLGALPRGETYDRATEQYAGVMADHDIPTALEWASSIGKPETRVNATRGVINDWIRKDAAAAQDWLKNDQTLPAEVRRNLGDQARAHTRP